MSHRHDHHGHGRAHDHDHDHDHRHGPGHNRASPGEHMHSHVHADPHKERADRLKALAAAFMEGFRKAEDKPAFVELAGIPGKRRGSDGLTMHLVDTAIESNWQLGTASPAFASRELVHLPYPAAMVHERERMTFTYVSLTERSDIELVTLLAEIQQPNRRGE